MKQNLMLLSNLDAKPKALFTKDHKYKVKTIQEIVANLAILKNILNDKRAKTLNLIDIKLAKKGESYFQEQDFFTQREVLGNITEMEIVMNKVLRTQINKSTKLYHSIKIEEIKEHHMHLAYLASTLEKLDRKVLEFHKSISSRLTKEYDFIDSAYLNTFVDYFAEFKMEHHLEHEMRRVLVEEPFKKYQKELIVMQKQLQSQLSKKRVKKSSVRHYLYEISTILEGYELLEKFVHFFNPKQMKFVKEINKIITT